MLRKLTPLSRPKEVEGQLWDDARELIATGAITPFISNSLATAIFGGEATIAASWAGDDEIRSPLSDSDNRDLARVTQYYSIFRDSRPAAKRYYVDSLMGYLLGIAQQEPQADPEILADLVERVHNRQVTTLSALAHELGYPRFPDPQRNPLRLLAEMPLPIYITTSYHDFLEVALARARPNPPVSEIFYWDDTLYDIPSVWDNEPGYTPSVDRPLVYHLYGLDKHPKSLVLTEDDYLDCLGRLTMLRYVVNSSNNNSSTSNQLNNKGALPAPVKIAVGGRSLLLLGYGINDWDFRVLFRGLIHGAREARVGNTNIPKSISMQITPRFDGDQTQEERQAAIKAYLKTFFAQSKFDVYWGDLEQCVYDLWTIHRA